MFSKQFGGVLMRILLSWANAYSRLSCDFLIGVGLLCRSRRPRRPAAPAFYSYPQAFYLGAFRAATSR